MHRVAAILTALFLLTGQAAADGYDTVRAALDAGDYDTAYAALAEMGDEGDTLAMIMLADLQVSEASGPSNYGLAVAWLEQAAGEGSIHAMLRLGAIYQKQGPAVFRDRDARVLQAVGYPEAVQWYDEAAEAGSMIAHSRLGGLYRLLLLSANDPSFDSEVERQLAREHFELAAAAGRPDAMALLAIELRRQDPDRSAELFRRAAVLGDPTAIGMLAVKPEEGGITDPVEVLAWVYAAKIAWNLDRNPWSPLFVMPGVDTGAQFLAAMDELIGPGSPEDRAAAEARAAEFAAGWTSLLPGQSGGGGGGLFGRN